jgi:hypothetical protein
MEKINALPTTILPWGFWTNVYGSALAYSSSHVRFERHFDLTVCVVSNVIFSIQHQAEIVYQVSS